MFTSREEAGHLLSEELRKRQKAVDVVLGIPRGGVLVAAEIARKLGINCSPLVIKKLGVPGNPELAIGAVSKNSVYLDEKLIQKLRISDDFLHQEIQVKQIECRQRERHGHRLDWVACGGGAAGQGPGSRDGARRSGDDGLDHTIR